MSEFVVCGRLLDTLALREATAEVAALRIDAEGIIVERAPDGTDAFDALRLRDDAIVLPPDHVLIAGLSDLHIHAPQWPQAGQALDRPLEDWLGAYTFPLEARYADPAFARAVYADLVPSLLACGTTSALYFSTIHEEASLELARACLAHGQRGFVGLVAMDDPGLCPPDYRHASAREALDATRRFIAAVRALPGNDRGLVQPVITPRFIPACSDALLEGLGALARETGVRVQTHASESDWAHQHVIERLGCTDSEALDRFGLLRPHTVLAHANFIDRDDRDRIRARDAAVAHCPISNAYFANSVLPLREILDEGVRCGLGTDIAGGYTPSIFENARQAVTSSRLRESGVDAGKPPALRGGVAGARVDFLEAFYLATRGGAEALGVSAGALRPGMMFDAVTIAGRRGHLRLQDDDTAATLVQKIVCHAGRETIVRVWVGGRAIKLKSDE
jgi:guanine deaminase